MASLTTEFRQTFPGPVISIKFWLRVVALPAGSAPSRGVPRTRG
jgi:hypothetical protein